MAGIPTIIFSHPAMAAAQPSTSSPTAGYEVAFQANNASLWTVGTAGNTSLTSHVLKATNPAVTAFSGGGQEETFQSTSGSLWTAGTAGNVNWYLGMMPATSPSITALPNGGYEVAFQSNTGSLWTASPDRSINWYLGMMPGTSPSITSVPQSLRLRIIQSAAGQIGYQDTPAGTYCNPYTAFWGAGSPCGNGTSSEQWCADFATFIWHAAGVSFQYGYEPGYLNASAASFYQWAVAQGTWHPARSGYVPQWGDAAVYGLSSSGTYADHVAIVTNLEPGSAGPDVVNGDWWSSSNGGVVAQKNETTADGSDTLSGYASPSS